MESDSEAILVFLLSELELKTLNTDSTALVATKKRKYFSI